MRIRLPAELLRPLEAALQRAGTREIGGQLFGEQLAPSDFRITTLTYQARPGTFSRFLVDLVQAARDAAQFFDRTQHHYRRFNYIGEWHSHPSFAVRPSGVDRDAMRQLVGDKAFVGSFAILMIVRLDPDRLHCGAWLFDPQGLEAGAPLEIEP